MLKTNLKNARKNARAATGALQAGFALQDMLLAIAVLGLMTAASLPLLGRNADEMNAKSIADDWKTFKTIADQHFQANRPAYEAAMQTGAGAATLCKINVNPVTGLGGTVANSTTLHTCAIDSSMLQYFHVLPDSIKVPNAYGESWVAIYKSVYAGSPLVPTGGVEAFFGSADVTGTGSAVAPDARRYQMAKSAGDYSGGGGGVVPDADRATCSASRAATTYEACGDGWKINLADFIDPASLTVFSNRLAN